MQDVEAALAEALGPEAALSKSTGARICQAIKDELDAWKLGDVSRIEREYLFCEGSHFQMHPGARAEPALCARGITTQGAPVLVGLTSGSDEGHDPWAGFLGALVDRGLRPPLLMGTDGRRADRRGRAGLLQPSAAALPDPPLSQPARAGAKHAQAEVKAAFWAIFDDSDAEPAKACALWRAWATAASPLGPGPPYQSGRAGLRRDPPAHQGDRPAAWAAQLPVAGVGGAGMRSRGWRGS
jgi:putative transposase